MPANNRLAEVLAKLSTFRIESRADLPVAGAMLVTLMDATPSLTPEQHEQAIKSRPLQN